jgi:two-component system alkaline phosphatase synthesis response regulator PhoP
VTTVCIVEDELSLSDMIRMNLELEGYGIISIHDGKEAVDRIDELCQADLVILDVMLPHKSGIDVCNELRKKSAVPVLFLSAKGTTADKIAGLKAGGNDYLAKPFDLEELLLRVKILVGRTFGGEESDTLTIGVKTVNFSTFEVRDMNNGTVTTLSKREIELLRLFGQNEGKVISRDEILDRVWGKDQFPTSRTIDNYILAFRKLFEVDPREPKYFHSVRSVGYKFTLNES